MTQHADFVSMILRPLHFSQHKHLVTSRPSVAGIGDAGRLSQPTHTAGVADPGYNKTKTSAPVGGASSPANPSRTITKTHHQLHWYFAYFLLVEGRAPSRPFRKCSIPAAATARRFPSIGNGNGCFFQALEKLTFVFSNAWKTPAPTLAKARAGDESWQRTGKKLERGMNRRHFIRTLALTGAALSTPLVRAAAPQFPAASWQSLPRWRGFNLLEKFQRDWNNNPFVETDFDWIAEWGFNFVRLPCDYRIWTEAPGKYREAPLKQLDQALAFARARGIHTLLNLHRAPGYTVAHPPEQMNLWSDGADGEEARAQFGAQWQMFAERYRGISSSELSFNLVNEPARIPAEKYVRACAAAVAGIRSADPARLVLADGLDWGSNPVPELKALQIAQATRGYAPGTITHYKANWVQGSDKYPLPTWPVLARPNGYFYGDSKKEWQTPLVLKGAFPAGTKVALHLTKISYAARIQIKADGKIILQKDFTTTAEKRQPEIKETLEAALTSDVKEISISMDKGDWVTWRRIDLAPPNRPATLLEGSTDWGKTQATWTVGADGVATCNTAKVECDRDVLWTKHVEPWIKLRDSGVGVMVGEWGCHSETPHPVVLAWARDCLANWKRANFGWALWNFRGSFGILDSNRKDVQYETFRGHKLDRELLELLRAN